jgi:hypothetical protein
VPSSTPRLVGAISLACLLAVVMAAISVSSANADLVNLSLCNGSALSQPFLPWADPSTYELAPGGDFGGAGVWATDGGARVVAGGEPYGASGSAQSALSLPVGGSAESPSTCVDAAYPTVRMFVAGTGAVAVEVVADGIVIPSGIAIASGPWTPTPIMVTGAALESALSGGAASVSLRLVGLSGDPRIDDVYIDPWNRG